MFGSDLSPLAFIISASAPIEPETSTTTLVGRQMAPAVIVLLSRLEFCGIVVE